MHCHALYCDIVWGSGFGGLKTCEADGNFDKLAKELLYMYCCADEGRARCVDGWRTQILRRSNFKAI